MAPDPHEHLTTGWEADLPAGDTLLRRAVLVHASFALAIASPAGRPVRRTERWAASHLADRGFLSNLAILLRPLDDPASVVAELSDFFPGHVTWALISAWPTGDLRPHGLALMGHPPLMVRFPGPPPPPVPPELELRAVGDDQTVDDMERVLVEGYPMTDLQPFVPRTVFDPAMFGPDVRAWVGYVDGRPITTALAHTACGLNLVENVATMADGRGKGYGAAATWAATLADPSLPAALIASDPGRPVYERMGYVAIERWTAWLRPGR